MDQTYRQLEALLAFALLLPLGANALRLMARIAENALRARRRRAWQDRRAANDAEHAKVDRAMRYEVLRRDGFRCVRCGRGAKDGVTLHVDHIRPVSRGGRSTMGNLQTLCEDCNMGKGNRYVE